MTASWKTFATVDPFAGMTGSEPGRLQNLAGGHWTDVGTYRDDIVDPMNGDAFLQVPDTQDMARFIEGLESCPKPGLHNPLRNNERYVHLGSVCARSAALLATPEVEEFFTKLTQRVMPKSWQQCLAEVRVTRVFLENFAGDGVRFLARGFSNPGDHQGQESRGYRWPFGPVVVVAPFNFPLEIPALQTMGALFMGNRPLVKVDSKVSVVFDQFIRMLIHCGLDPADLDYVHCRGEKMGELITEAADTIRLAQFTGSSTVAERVAETLNGRVRLEDAGFDWKIIGPDYDAGWLDYVAWQCDEDAYNATGQKCSAQSALFVHDNWTDSLLPKLQKLAARRGLDDLTVGPVLSWTNQQIKGHIDAVLAVDGTELLFGGKPLTGHSIPDCFGAYEPTAIRVPLSAMQGEAFDVVARELFGPFQIVVTYGDDEIDTVLAMCEQMENHLTAAVVSADILFQQKVLGATVNGTTYCGMRARTTGAPQNHWFGPSGDPRGAGIGTPEAIQITWSAHREIIADNGPMPEGWETPPVR
ncbi:MAG: aldehyde dehydrogenase family protein [Gammaproteobacteria bacterium]|nr:aldehyde dehydrogenase family protein [Gammaproteobacteria bacterium]